MTLLSVQALALYPNISDRQSEQIKIRMAFGTMDPRRYLQSDGLLIYRGLPVEDECTFDTGASITVLSSEVSRKLNIRPSIRLQQRVLLADGSDVRLFKTCVSLRIGGNWHFIDVLVPHPNERANFGSLIGMKGLLKRFSFLVSSEHVLVCDKYSRFHSYAPRTP